MSGPLKRDGRLWIEWTGDISRSRRLSISAESTVFYTPFKTGQELQDNKRNRTMLA